MANTSAKIVAHAEVVFDHHGFAGTGMDRLTAAANVSTRTLYKHLGSKAGLIAAVLDSRRARFFDRFDVESIDALFDTLETWTVREGARGCMYLRARSEDGEWAPEVVSIVAAYRQQLYELIRRSVRNRIGRDDDVRADQVLVLFEGATSAASYRGVGAIRAAKSAAIALLAQSR